MKIGRKYEGILFAFVMAVVISIPMSFFMTLYNAGISSRFMGSFISGSIIGILISTPLSFFAIPIVKKLVLRLIRE